MHMRRDMEIRPHQNISKGTAGPIPQNSIFLVEFSGNIGRNFSAVFPEIETRILFFRRDYWKKIPLVPLKGSLVLHMRQ